MAAARASRAPGRATRCTQPTSLTRTVTLTRRKPLVTSAKPPPLTHDDPSHVQPAIISVTMIMLSDL